MARRSPYAQAAEGYLRANSTPGEEMPSKKLWSGLCSLDPALTESTPKRKTPRNTCMRDLRKDGAFVVGKGKVKLSA